MKTKIQVEKPSLTRLEQLGVSSWPIWECPPSTFPWHYQERETCYLLEGRVKIRSREGDEVEIGKGDLVTFPPGLHCTWEVLEPVRKHYRLEP
jgi:uncharacterized cupin superfamily protein